MTSMMPVDYSPTQYIHPHDLVFQQMLRSAQLPAPAFFRSDLMTRPMAPEPYTRRERRQLAMTSESSRSESSGDSDLDDGYHADKDNGPRKLLKGERALFDFMSIED